jgi:hypothetical protein
MIYLCQQNAWMDEEAMIVWVDQVLRPYIETAPAGILHILFLDSYRCHMMASVVGMIQDLGVEVKHIPGRCTSLCQPVDIGVNKPFKNRIRNQWEEWMIAEGLANGTTVHLEIAALHNRPMTTKFLQQGRFWDAILCQVIIGPHKQEAILSRCNF